MQGTAVKTEVLLAPALLCSVLLLSSRSKEDGVAPASQSPSARPASQSTRVKEPVRSDQIGAPDHSLTREAWIELPKTLQFPGTSSVEAASSWSARLAELSSADQAYMAEIGERYFGSVTFMDEAEQRLLIRQGFPMPEEWLAARNISDAELEKLAKTGNLKAQMFQTDRISARIAPIAAGRGIDDSPAGRELFRQFVETDVMAGNMLRNSQSPFAAYLYGRFRSSGTQGNQPELMAAAFELAKDLGDQRADSYRTTFFERHPGLNAELIMLGYSGMKLVAKPEKVRVIKVRH
jgi:hypothetical protein